jgi:hypothetical protein
LIGWPMSDANDTLNAQPNTSVSTSLLACAL